MCGTVPGSGGRKVIRPDLAPVDQPQTWEDGRLDHLSPVRLRARVPDQSWDSSNGDPSQSSVRRRSLQRSSIASVSLRMKA
jgi:hypothetical protein